MRVKQGDMIQYTEGKINVDKGILYINNFSKLDKSVGIKLNIMRFKPTWLNDNSVEDMIELAPSVALLNSWNSNKITWEEYTDIYLQELKESNLVGLRKLTDLLDKGNNITIHCTCAVSSEGHCHRYIIKDLIERSNYLTMEIPNKKEYKDLSNKYELLDENMKIKVYNMINKKDTITMPRS